MKAFFKKIFGQKEEPSAMAQHYSERAIKYGIKGVPFRLFKNLGTEQEAELVSEFEANGVTYAIFKPSEVFNIDRHAAFRHLQIAFGTGSTVGQIKKSFQFIYQSLGNLITASNEETRSDAYMGVIKECLSNEAVMFSETAGTVRYAAALYIATLFILPKDADLSKPWSFEDADKAIDDWSKANIAIKDFFLLVTHFCKDTKGIIEENSL